MNIETVRRYFLFSLLYCVFFTLHSHATQTTQFLYDDVNKTKADLLVELSQAMNVDGADKESLESLLNVYLLINDQCAKSATHNPIIESKIENLSKDIFGCQDKINTFNGKLQSKIGLLVTLFLNKGDIE